MVSSTFDMVYSTIFQNLVYLQLFHTQYLNDNDKLLQFDVWVLIVGLGFADTVTRRVADAVFSPTVLTIVGVLALPLLVAAAYWLFVVNGPTPVVKARIDELLGYKFQGHM